MTTTTSINKAEDLIDTASYAMFYIDSHRRNISHQVATISGAMAKQSLALSADPARLYFVLLQEKTNG